MKKTLIYLLLPMLLLSSCVSEEEIVNPGNNDGKQLEATLTLRVTGGSTADTRASLSEMFQNEIKEIDVLVFTKEPGDTGNGTFDYRAQTTLIGTDVNDITKKNFKVTLRRSTDSNDLQRLVVLANCRSAVEALDMTDMTYEEVSESLTMTTPINAGTNNYGVWNVISATHPDPLPMWGEQSDFSVLSGTNAVPDVIELFRAVASIDVVVSEGAQSDFELDGVCFYTLGINGRLIPSSANWNSTEKKAIAPTIPSTRTLNSKRARISPLYPDELKNRIYVFEQPAAAQTEGTPAELEVEPYLIVNGSYKGGAQSFYRVDFFGKNDEDDTNDTFLPLLRNFRYTVTIDQVDGPGYPTGTEAFQNRFTNITATTHTWSQGDMGSVVWDGHHYLAVTATTYELDNTQQSIDYIKVATNYDSTDDDWTAKVTLDSDDETNWLSILPFYAYGDGDDVARTILMNVLPNTDRDRTAIVTVTAGRLKQEIRIMQRVNKQLSLEVGDIEMKFSASTPVATLLRVEWTPGTVPVKATYAPVSGYAGLSFSPTALPDVTDDDASTQEGTRNYSIKPEMFTPSPSNPFEERRSTLTLTAKDGTEAGANATTKTVTLRQFNPAIRANVSSIVCEQLTSYTLNVRSNDEWEMIENDPNDVIATISTPVGEPITTATGEVITFRTNDRNRHGKEATLTFRHVKNHDVKYDVTIRLAENEANCYIVKPGETQLINIAKVFSLWKNDPDLNSSSTYGDASAMSSTSTYKVELLWQDTQGLIASASDIGNLTIDHPGQKGSFTVKTANKQGNAVVVLKEGETIRWSWHIWVCDFDPDANTGYNAYNGATFMDRNVGATSVTPGDVKANGFLYQWGRKDPFPGAAGYTPANNYDSAPIYDINNVQLTEDATDGGTGVKKTPVATGRNLRNAVENPLTYYNGTFNNYYDWFSNSAHSNGTIPVPGLVSHRTNLWGTKKSQYDPCPDGWQVPTGRGMMASYVRPGAISNYGVMLEQIGYVPMAGRRVDSTGGLEEVGTKGYTASIVVGTAYTVGVSTYAYHYYAGNFGNNTIAEGMGSIAFGVSVRCAKIK